MMAALQCSPHERHSAIAELHFIIVDVHFIIVDLHFIIVDVHLIIVDIPFNIAVVHFKLVTVHRGIVVEHPGIAGVQFSVVRRQSSKAVVQKQIAGDNAVIHGCERVWHEHYHFLPYS